MKVSDLDKAPYLRMLVYGDSGSGKTTFVGSAMECEDTSPLLVLNASGQPVSLRYLKSRPLVLEIESIKDFNIVYTWLLKNQDMDLLGRLDGPLAAVVAAYLNTIQADKFKCLAVDSITQVQRLAMDRVTTTPDSKGRVVGPSMPENPGDIPAATQIQHWGRTLALMTNFADRFYKLPIHVIMTALCRRDNIPSMGYTLFCPFLWGQSNMEIPSHAEIVGRLMNTGTIGLKEQKDVKTASNAVGKEVPFNIMYLRGGRDFVAKWQGILNPPAMMANPTIAKFIKHYATGA